MSIQHETIGNIQTRSFVDKGNRIMNVAQYHELKKFQKFNRLRYEIEIFLLNKNKRIPTMDESKDNYVQNPEELRELPNHFLSREPLTVNECSELFEKLDRLIKDLGIEINPRHQGVIKFEF